MSDKFIKFGPAWLRDFGREGTTSNFQNQGSNNASNSSSNTSVTNTSGPNTNTSSPQQPPKVQLAKLRYGREEILALYTAQEQEPPAELRHLEHLFNSRGKPPLALLNTFDDDPRDNARGGPPAGGNAQNERFGLGRGYLVFNESRGKARLPFIQRTVTTGRGPYMKQHGSPSLLGFPERSAEEPPFDVSHRSNWANNNPNNINLRNSTEAEWNNNPNKMYNKSRWQGHNTNWRRQPNERRGDDDEWRLSEAAGGGPRPRSMQQQEKWEWGDKGEQRGRERSQPWHNNRRTWAADSPGAEENLPEWAMDSAEACGGTFDSSGAFHGYSNDDSNIPKTTSENTYALSRSHTQGSFSRSKPIDENSDEWWASEKAKVLSPKRFDAVEPKFKKSPNNRGEETSASRSLNTGGTQQQQQQQQQQVDIDLKFEELGIDPNDQEQEKRANHKKNVHFKQKLMESKTFDALMRSDINVEEASDERGNFKSVMITPNNSLRQRHQNLVSTALDLTINQNVTAQSSHPIGTPTQTIGDRFMGQPSSPSEEEIAKYIKASRSEPDTCMENTSPASSYQSQAAKAASIRKPAESIGGPLPQSSDMNSSNMSYSRMHNAMTIPAPGSIMSAGMRLSIGSTTPKPTTPTGVARNGINDILNMPLHAAETPGMIGANIPMPTSQHMAHMPMATSTGLPMQNLQNSGRSGLNELLNIPLPRETPSLNAAGIPMPKSHAVGVPIQNLQHGVGLSGRIMNSAGLMCQVTSSLPTTGICTTRVQSQANSTLPASNMSNTGLSTSTMIGTPRSSTSVTGYSAAAAGLPSATSSLFLGQKSNTIPVGGGQSNMFLQGLQQQPTQSSFGSSMYSGITPNPAEQWYYEDPEKNIQGPFSSSAMYNWYRNGFFTAHLMVRRACDNQMRPLGSYGPVPPFDKQAYGGIESGPYAPHDNLRKTQGGLSDVIHNRPNIPDGNLNAMGFGNVGNNYMMAPNYSTQPMVDSLWGQPSPSADMMWMQPNLNARNETSVNSLPMFLWNHESSSQSSLLPESITKEMKTEDEILAQLRASQNIATNQTMGFHNDPATQKKVASNLMAEETALSQDGLGLENLAKLMTRDTQEVSRNMNQNLEDLEKIIQSETFGIPTPAQHKSTAVETHQASLEALEGLSISSEESNYSASANKAPEKQMKTDIGAKTNKKKTKKDQSEVSKEQDVEERTEGSPVTKSKKEKKQTKKEIEKEKKEWVKEGFTIVKAPEKSKDNKKKECKLAEEAERKRKEDEKLAEEEKKKILAESLKKQQVNHPQRPSIESVMRKAPWSAVSAGQAAVTLKDGLTLAEIQRFEREKKAEQIKEQQQMMQLIAQQQQAALAREQEMQAGLGWAKRAVSYPNRGQSLTEIQRAETRKQQQAAVTAAAAAAVNAASQMLEPSREAATSHHVWGSCPTEAGFWDTDRINLTQTPVKPIEKPAEPVKPVKPVEVPKAKKKPAAPPVVAVKKEITPQTEFENWCETVLVLWSSKIDVPTFVGFLKDIESPYEVKDYVKCYLGDTKESCDFARQFLEKRSKLLRSSTRSPADDLCSPAVAVNPRSASNAEYQEVKGKGKKNKKKMFKVDARILGFSVTAAEDRINVGDIDTA